MIHEAEGVTLRVGDVREVLDTLPDGSVDCVVTSPPYWGLRDYGTGSWEGGDPDCEHSVGGQVEDSKAPGAISTGQRPGVDASRCRTCGATRVDRQIGLEATPAEFVASLVDVFREVRRVLADHGTCWLNLGDSYANDTKWGGSTGGKHVEGLHGSTGVGRQKVTTGLKAKDLVGIPWRVALALQDDGWYLRSDIIWSKPNPMPESVTDRPTKSHEYVFMLTKQPRYFFDQEAVREGYKYDGRSVTTVEGKGGSIQSRDGERWPGLRPQTERAREIFAQAGLTDAHLEAIRACGSSDAGKAQITQTGYGKNTDEMQRLADEAKLALGGYYREFLTPQGGRNIRSVWEIATQSYSEAHFATFPEALPKRCIEAGCPTEVCRTCGKPRERIVERVATGFDGSKYGERAVAATGGATSGGTAASTLGSGNGKLTADHETVGWTDCGHDDYRRGIVLDPFFGAGTTALVARKLGRETVGVELNPEYAKLALLRLLDPATIQRVALESDDHAQMTFLAG